VVTTGFVSIDKPLKALVGYDDCATSDSSTNCSNELWLIAELTRLDRSNINTFPVDVEGRLPKSSFLSHLVERRSSKISK